MRSTVPFITRFSAGLAIVVTLGAATPVLAQAYSGCGTLIDQVFGGCVELFQPLGTSDVYQLNGIGSPGFTTGDVIYIEGDLLPLCATFCAITACVNVTFVSECGVPIDECGILVLGAGGCTLFESLTGERYELENLGAFEVGDAVRIDGLLDTGCITICIADGCVTGNSIELCNAEFVRGDANDDGAIDISDPIAMLEQLFTPGTTPTTCRAALDTNSDDAVDIADVIYHLAFLFVPGSPPPGAPFPDCGDQAGTVGCVLFMNCP